MAITKLLHMKESGTKNPSIHLKNSIAYILNQKKTQDGRLTGGLGSLGADEAYHQFLDTKKTYGKMEGRQGYHFVISFAPGEVEADTAFQITQEFTEKYLNNYECVYSVHDDTNHLHGHIVFNSVSFDGKKYHYSKGDWEKDIQPITNSICKKYNLSTISFENTEEKNKSYLQWQAEKEGSYTWNDYIRMDIDEAIEKSNTYEEFLEHLAKREYTVRSGISKEKGEYFSIKPKEKKRAVRSYLLGNGYTAKDIKERISYSYQVPTQKEFFCVSYVKRPHFKKYFFFCYKPPQQIGFTAIQGIFMKRWHFLWKIFKQPEYRQPSYEYRKECRRSMYRIHVLQKQCLYLCQNNVKSEKELLERKSMCEEKIKAADLEKKASYRLYGKYRQEFTQVKEYWNMKKYLMENKNRLTDREYEEIEDKMEKICRQIPFEEIENKYKQYKEKLEEIGKVRKTYHLEEKMIIRILEDGEKYKNKISDLLIQKNEKKVELVKNCK